MFGFSPVRNSMLVAVRVQGGAEGVIGHTELFRESAAGLELERADAARFPRAGRVGGDCRRRFRLHTEAGAHLVEGEGCELEPVDAEEIDTVVVGHVVVTERAAT